MIFNNCKKSLCKKEYQVKKLKFQMKKRNHLKFKHKLKEINMNLKIQEILKKSTLVINHMMNIYNIPKKYMKNGQEQVNQNNIYRYSQKY